MVLGLLQLFQKLGLHLLEFLCLLLVLRYLGVQDGGMAVDARSCSLHFLLDELVLLELSLCLFLNYFRFLLIDRGKFNLTISVKLLFHLLFGNTQVVNRLLLLWLNFICSYAEVLLRLHLWFQNTKFGHLLLHFSLFRVQQFPAVLVIIFVHVLFDFLGFLFRVCYFFKSAFFFFLEHPHPVGQFLHVLLNFEANGAGLVVRQVLRFNVKHNIACGFKPVLWLLLRVNH